jgi:hypothetical protein
MNPTIVKSTQDFQENFTSKNKIWNKLLQDFK